MPGHSFRYTFLAGRDKTIERCRSTRSSKVAGTIYLSKKNGWKGTVFFAPWRFVHGKYTL